MLNSNYLQRALCLSFVTLGLATASYGQDTDIQQLRQQLADQAKQIEDLRQMLQLQQNLLQGLAQPKTEGSASVVTPAGSPPAQGYYNPATVRDPNLVASLSPVLPRSLTLPSALPQMSATARDLGIVASLAPVVPRSSTPTRSFAMPQNQLGAAATTTTTAKNPCEADVERVVPTFLRIGNVCIVPIGFMDLVPLWRDKNAGSSMGSNFGSVPYNNTANGNLSEFRFSSQNSRIGFRIDGDWMGTHFIGYNEFDFNGTSGSTNLAVSNGAIVPRLRLFWADARKGKWEFLAGQSWSMLTPNRNGLSALPGDLFYTQVIDINYIAGLTWTRQPGMRLIYHPNKQWALGFSVEQPNQYIGGSAGGSPIVLPAALTGLAGTQLDNASNIATGTGAYLSEPTVTPDFISKIAYDPNSRVHLEVGGILTNAKITTLAAPFNVHHTTVGAGILFGANVAVTKNVRLMSTNYISDGAGRYLFGQAPDLIVRANGSMSGIKADGTVDGVEATIKNTLLYAYYGGIYINRNVAFDANGTTPVGFGFTGSPNSQNRAIQEVTFGINQTIWRNPRYGAINLASQYEYLMRSPWFVAPGTPTLGAPKAAHTNTLYFNIRYSLPGSMPNF
jgi:hypothetical protein